MGKDKTRTGGIGRIDPDAATEDHGYLAADGKAEARALLLVAIEFLETVEDHLPWEVNLPALVSRLIRICDKRWTSVTSM